MRESSFCCGKCSYFHRCLTGCRCLKLDHLSEAIVLLPSLIMNLCRNCTHRTVFFLTPLKVSLWSWPADFVQAENQTPSGIELEVFWTRQTPEYSFGQTFAYSLIHLITVWTQTIVVHFNTCFALHKCAVRNYH